MPEGRESVPGNSPYTRTEIEAFVGVALKVITTTDVLDPAYQHARYADAIERLPPWHQVLLIENRSVSVVGDSETINKLYNKGAAAPIRVNGFFHPGALSLQFNATEKIEGRNMTFWHTDERGEGGDSTRDHEDGHRLVQLIEEGSNKDPGYFSLQSPLWKGALAAEIRSREERRLRGELPPHRAEADDGRGMLAWLNKCLGVKKKEKAVEIDGTKIDFKLYDDYREIEDHLRLYDDKESHEDEAFAEMTAHHTAVYARYRGNDRAIDYLLTQHYPYLWPAYRDHVIPEMEKRAGSLLQLRQDHIDDYMMNAWRLTKVQDMPLDESAALTYAGVAAARGTIVQESAVLQQRAALYENPMPTAVRVWKDIVEMYWHIHTDEKEQYRQPFTFDYDDVQREMKEKLDSAGIDGFINYIDALRAERRELDAMAKAEERFAINVGLQDIRPGSAEARAVLLHFNQLMAAGDAEAVRAYRLSLPNRDQIHSYIIARTGLEETRSSILQEGAVIQVPVQEETPEVLAAELRALAAQGGRENVEQATEDAHQQGRALSRYYGRLSRTAEAISKLAGTAPSYFSGTDIVAQFDGLMAQGGIAAVDDEIKRLTIPMDILSAYADAREDSESARVSIANEGSYISWGSKDGIFRPFRVAVHEMASDFPERLAMDMRAMIMNEGGARIEAETARLRHETHLTVGRAVGRLPPQAGGVGV